MSTFNDDKVQRDRLALYEDLSRRMLRLQADITAWKDASDAMLLEVPESYKPEVQSLKDDFRAFAVAKLAE